jgi:vacuolar-type H+-ATPase subunit H
VDHTPATHNDFQLNKFRAQRNESTTLVERDLAAPTTQKVSNQVRESQMAETEIENRLSPLDQIRQTEAEVTRQVAAAREAAGQTVAEARTRSARHKQEALLKGHREGQALYKEAVSKAQEQARRLITQAQDRAVELRRSGYQRMDLAVQQTVNIVIGLEGEEAGK